MVEVRWRPQALRDLEAIETYYTQVAPDFAAVFVAGAFEAAQRLARFPRSGRRVREIGDEAIREVLYRQYRLVYIVTDDAVEILTLYPMARPLGGAG